MVSRLIHFTFKRLARRNVLEIIIMKSVILCQWFWGCSQLITFCFEIIHFKIILNWCFENYCVRIRFYKGITIKRRRWRIQLLGGPITCPSRVTRLCTIRR